VRQHLISGQKLWACIGHVSFQPGQILLQGACLGLGVRSGNVAAATEAPVDIQFPYVFLDGVDGLVDKVVQQDGSLGAELLRQFCPAVLVAQNHHPAVAPAGTPACVVSLQHTGLHPLFHELPGGIQAGEAATHNRAVDMQGLCELRRIERWGRNGAPE